MRIRVVSEDDAWAAALQGQIARRGLASERARGWAAALVAATDAQVGLLLLDGTLAGADGALLAQVARHASTSAVIRVARGALEPLVALRDAEELHALAAAATPPLIDPTDARQLPLAGLGPDPLGRLQAIARTPTPVVFQGERGTGKQWLARLTHQLSRVPGPFVVRGAEEDITLHGAEPGTLLIERVDLVSPDELAELIRLSRATGWKLLGSTRDAPAARFAEWAHVPLRPLRERPRDIRPLARLYLDQWSTRLGLPARRVHHTLWALIERHPWPGNHRELETFIVQAATSTRGPMISRGSLPHQVLARLDPVAREAREVRAFEEMVEERLKDLVGRYAPDPDSPSLYRLAVDATERALFRLALQQTGGSQKAAARLLGVARNTLRSRLHALDPSEEAR